MSRGPDSESCFKAVDLGLQVSLICIFTLSRDELPVGGTDSSSRQDLEMLKVIE